MRKSLGVLAVASAPLWLAACAHRADMAEGPPPTADTIRFAAGACFGACPSYSVTIEPDGSGVLIPQKNTAVPGETRFTVTPAQYRRLRTALAPWRPATGTKKRIAPGENCERAATDMPGYQIEWSRRGQGRTNLDFYSGCFDARYAGLRRTVSQVPAILEIQRMLSVPAKPGG
ncbi:DUF6438 domain-containing protein [Sphingobium aquiterrae]|uniref:DUF6438 domain-containing protein n=1 Tax=Sphingobium aquiterrae TaxID=2038656 RepID=UPI003018F5BF